MRRYVLLAVALTAGILAFVITKIQIQKEYRRLNLLAKKVKVVVPKTNLVKGDVIQHSDLSIRAIFAASASGEEILLSDVAQVIGQKLVVDKKRDTFFQWRDFEMPTVGFGGSVLAKTIQKRERALSLSVDAPSSVSSMIRPNDHVDIVGSFRFPAEQPGSALDTVALTILQNVTVLAVGQQLSSSLGGQEGDRARSYSTLTLAVTPKEAEMLVFAQQKGTLTFTLRHPTDPYMESDIQNVDFNFLKKNSGLYTRERGRRLEQLPQGRH